MKVPPRCLFREAKLTDGKLPSTEHAIRRLRRLCRILRHLQVDAEKCVVTHHVDGSLAPDFTDTGQPRPFKVEGDRLEIGDCKTWRHVLERVR